MEKNEKKDTYNDELTAIFGVLLGIYNEIKCKNDVEWYELCYRNAIMNKNEFVSAAKKAVEDKKSNENALILALNKIKM